MVEACWVLGRRRRVRNLESGDAISRQLFRGFIALGLALAAGFAHTAAGPAPVYSTSAPAASAIAARLFGDRLVLDVGDAPAPADAGPRSSPLSVRARREQRDASLTLRFIGADSSLDVAQATSVAKYPAAPAGVFPGDPLRRQLRRDLYPGIDLALYSVAGGVEYDLIVHPGARADGVTLRFENADARTLTAQGDLWLRTGVRWVRHAAPLAYQTVAGVRVPISARYVLDDAGDIRFALGEYDRRRELVVDPFIAVSRFVGGTGDDRIEDLASGPDGSLFAYGTIDSTNFPGVDPAQVANGGQGHVFVAKIRPQTLAIDWVAVVGKRSANARSTLFNYTIEDDRVEGFTVGNDGTVYVAAYATSSRFPAIGGVYSSGVGPKYIFRIDAQGNVTPHSGPLDPAIQTIRTVAVDAHGSVHFAGRALAELVTTPAAVVAGAAVAAGDTHSPKSGPYVAKLDASGKSVLVSTFLTVPQSRPATPDPETCRQPITDERTTAHALAIATDGSIFVAGQAEPGDLPATGGALDTLDFKHRDAFVAKLDSNGTALRFVARLGGRDNDRATGLAITPGGTVVVVGKSLESYWDVRTTGFQGDVQYLISAGTLCEVTPPEFGFLITLAADGGHMLGRAMIGATGGNLDVNSMSTRDPSPLRLKADSTGNLYVAGTSQSDRDLPNSLEFVPNGALYIPGSSQARPFVLAVDSPNASALSGLSYGSRFGTRNGGAIATGVAADGTGNAFVAGYGWGPGFPVVNAAAFPHPDQYGYAFITRINAADAPVKLSAAPFALVETGNPIQLTAQLADVQSAGTIEFRDKGNVIASAPVSGGLAKVSVVLPVGFHKLSAILRGAGIWDGYATTDQDYLVRQSGAKP